MKLSLFSGSLVNILLILLISSGYGCVLASEHVIISLIPQADLMNITGSYYKLSPSTDYIEEYRITREGKSNRFKVVKSFLHQDEPENCSSTFFMDAMNLDNNKIIVGLQSEPQNNYAYFLIEKTDDGLNLFEPRTGPETIALAEAVGLKVKEKDGMLIIQPGSDANNLQNFFLRALHNSRLTAPETLYSLPGDIT